MNIVRTGEDLPEKIGRYQIERELGRGGMGIVYLAKDPFIGRLTAVKSSLEPPPSDPEKLKAFQYRFFNEAHAAGKLAHPNVVYLYDASVEADHCYLVLEYVDGVTLAPHCRKNNFLPIEQIINIIYQCAKGLDHAHKKNVIHRDIKPSNIMINSNGSAKITDFGIAAVDGPIVMEKDGSTAASLNYSSPEQLKQTILNNQTDIFSLGVVMYELLTGAKPFEAETEIGLYYQVTNESPNPMQKHRSGLPSSLQNIVTKCLNRDLSERYKTGMQLAWELSAYFDHLRHLEDSITMEEKHHTLKRIGFFKDFTARELSEVVDVTQWVSFKDGSEIITEGAIEDCFYIIVSGGAKVTKKGKTLGRLNAGDCFGEMAYMGKTTRTANVTAVGETEMMRVNPTVIDQTSKDTQLRFYRVFSTNLVHRLINANELTAKMALK